MSSILQLPETEQLSLILKRRLHTRLQSKSDESIFLYLADTIYTEQRRLQENAHDAHPKYLDALHTATRCSRGTRSEMEHALNLIVNSYTHEIHNHFSSKTYRLASKVLPQALTRLLTASQPTSIWGSDFDPASKITVQGPTDILRKLSKNHTLIYTPTHVSNLDSPLVGYALSEIDLPPVIYGAGLNLFSNPVMAFFMSRLGAYTVDRRKKNQLYKDVLKDYSIEAIVRGCHSLFYPGGTRSRSGKIESYLKKGLLGTALQAWQENIEQGVQRDVLIVPCTLSYSLTLEAETLISDSLAEQGKARYIISDDEFSDTKTIANFTRRILNLDSSVYVRFGYPLDPFGNPVDDKGFSLDPNGNMVDRREYICDRNGNVQQDSQRDFMYTRHLTTKITEVYKKDNIALPTHVAALAAWILLRQKHPLLDEVQLAVLDREDRCFEKQILLEKIKSVFEQISDLRDRGEIHSNLPSSADRILDIAIQRFHSFHKKNALAMNGATVIIEGELTLYYANRLMGYGIT
jgi:glycerol-3-phosphate O-acyltransferase